MVTAGPKDIEYSNDTGRFVLTLEAPNEEVFNAPDPKILQIYNRTAAIDKINYGPQGDKKPNAREIAALTCVLNLPMEYMPDPRVVKEDAQDQEKLERDMKERAERAAEEKKIREA